MGGCDLGWMVLGDVRMKNGGCEKERVRGGILWYLGWEVGNVIAWVVFGWIEWLMGLVDDLVLCGVLWG